MMFHYIFFNALDFSISLVLATRELDNDGAYLNPLKQAAAEARPFLLQQLKITRARSLKRAS